MEGNDIARLKRAIKGVETMTGVQIFGATVQQLRWNADWSQAELANRSGLSIGSIERAERGQNINMETAFAIAHGFGCELYELL